MNCPLQNLVLSQCMEGNQNAEISKNQSNKLEQLTPSFNRYSNMKIQMDTINTEEEETTLKQQQQPQISYYEQQKHQEEGEDNNQFVQLKRKMAQIQCIAMGEIKILREELEKQKNIRYELELQLHELKSNQNRTYKQDANINTDVDTRDEQIQALKEGLLRHVRINKHLMELNKSKDDSLMSQMINSINL